MMNKDSTDFMLAEFEHSSTDYLALQTQVNDWFKAHLTIVGFPLTVLAAVLKLGTADISASITSCRTSSLRCWCWSRCWGCSWRSALSP